MKKLLFIQINDQVKDTVLENVTVKLSPFLLMDYAGPFNFKKKLPKKNKAEFEIVTIVYSDEIEQRDVNNSSLITAGDIKWMAGHAALIYKATEPAQLWINLPGTGHLGLVNLESDEIPLVQLPHDAGKLRVVAGDYLGLQGPILTLSPINLWDMRLNAGHTLTFMVPENHTAAFFIFSGEVTMSDGRVVGAAELAILERAGDSFTITTTEHTKILFLGGEPVNEPIVGSSVYEIEAPEKIRTTLLVGF